MYIVKVQLSILTSHENRRCLIYNRDQSIMWEGDAWDDVLEAMKGRLKAFFYARVDNEGRLLIGRRIKDKAW